MKKYFLVRKINKKMSSCTQRTSENILFGIPQEAKMLSNIFPNKV